MVNFVLRRLLHTVPLLLIISVIVSMGALLASEMLARRVARK